MADGTAPTVEDRVALLERYAQDLSKWDRLAARHLFSEFAHLESIAVMAAERGDCIPGQLEDERVHRATFTRLANRYGGLVEPCPDIVALFDYLTGLQGADSIAALNVVAEAWLETVFRHVGKWLMPKLFAAIGEDEKRHTQSARELPITHDVEPILRRLEDHLEHIAVAPAFMLPLIYFGGEKAICDMGLALCDAHEMACYHLGLETRAQRVRLLCRSQRILYRRRPELASMSPWDRTKQRIYGIQAPMLLWFDVPAEHTGVRFQARLVGALARILQRDPRLRTVVRRGQLYRVREPLIAVRALYDDRMIRNIVIAHGQYATDKAVLRQINRRVKKMRSVEYPEVPELPDGLDQLIPPSRIACAVNYNRLGAAGTGPLSDVEGIPILVTVGEPVGGKATITISMDHRTHDGQDIGRLQRELERELQPAKAGFLLGDA